MINATRVGFPLPLVVTIVTGFLFGYIRFDGQARALEKRIDIDTAAVLALTVDPAHTWRRWDMVLWCARAVKLNKEFLCPDAYGQPAARRR